MAKNGGFQMAIDNVRMIFDLYSIILTPNPSKFYAIISGV
jgi:hypothetical protein